MIGEFKNDGSEFICKKCKGTGLGQENDDLIFCEDCCGIGKFDWTENATGKKVSKDKLAYLYRELSRTREARVKRILNRIEEKRSSNA